MLKTLLFYRYGKFYRRRSALSHLALRSEFPDTFLLPLGTLLVNILGCFAIGLFYGLFERGNLMNPNLRMCSHRRILWRIHHLFNLHE